MTANRQPNDAVALRQRAEEQATRAEAASRVNGGDLSAAETGRLLHELRVHQIELELQNEELRRAQVELGASQARYFDLYDLAPVGYCSLNAAGLISEANLTAAGLLGVARSALVKHPLSRFVLKADQDIYYQHRRRLLETRTPQTCELRLVRQTGETFWARLAATVAQDDGGAPVSRLVISDITAQKQAEAARRESEARYRLISDNAADVIWVLDPVAGRFTYVSPSVEKLRGYTTAEILAQPMTEALTPESGARVGALLAQNLSAFLAQGSSTVSFVTEVDQPHKDGSIVHTEATTTYVRNERGQVEIVGVSRDITERKRAETALKASEQRWRALIENIDDGIELIDAQGQVLYASPSAARILGYPQAELSGPATRLIHPEDLAAAEGTLAQVFGAPGQPISQTYRVRHGDGTWRWVEGTATNLLADPTVGGIVVNFRDITARKQAEEARWESAERLRLAHKATNDVVWDWDIVQDTQQWNEAGATVFGWTDIVATPQTASWWVSRVHPDDRQRVEQGFFAVVDDPAKTSWHDEYRFRKADGSYAQVLDRGYVLRNAAGQAFRMIGAMLDITARKEAEQALRESEEKYRGLMESLDSVVTTVDYDGKLLYVNDVAAQQMDSTVQALTGKTMHDIFPAPIASEQLQDIRRVMHTDRGTVTESQVIVRGRPRWHRTMMQPIHDEHGRVTCVLVNSTDIHDLKTTQQELLELNRTLEGRVRERTAQVQDLYDNAPMGYHSLDAAGNMVMVNQTELDWLGYTREEVLGQHISSFLSPASRAVFETYFPNLKQSGAVRDAEIEFVRKDGTRFLALLNSSAIYDARGNFVMSRSSLLDITTRKQAENALRESEEQNRLMFDAAPDATALFDAAGWMVRVNTAFEHLTGYRADQVAGRMFAELALLSREQIAQMILATTEAFKSSRIAAIECQLRRANGEPRDVSVHIFGITIGGRQHYIATVRDITAEKQAAETLRRTLEQQKELNELKSRFVSMTSHEFRTPLTVIFSSTELLELYGARWPDEKKQVHYRRMKTAVQNMTRLLEDILILGRVEAGRLTFSPAPLDLAQFCRGMMEELQLGAGAGYALEFTHEGDDGPVRMDEKLLRQILTNLLSNAIKYSPAGGPIRLAVRCAGGQATFEVADRGIGIPADAQARLFEMFHRAQNVGAIPGTGLGLAIVKKSVELHQGTITCASAVGQGTTFTVTLPTDNE